MRFQGGEVRGEEARKCEGEGGKGEKGEYGLKTIQIGIY